MANDPKTTKTSASADPEKIQLSTKKTKKPPIDLDPTIHRGSDLKETFSDSKLDQLIRDGLGSDPLKIMMYKRALKDPQYAVTNLQLRGMVGEVLEKLLGIVLNDSTMYNKVRHNLHHHNESVAAQPDNNMDRIIEAAVRSRSLRPRDDK